MSQEYKNRGKKNRAAGKAFENKVRLSLEKKGWIVSKWVNTIKWDEDNINRPPEERTGKLIPAKPQFNPFFKRIVGEGSGFPDFIAFKLRECESKCKQCAFCTGYDIIGVESKINGYLKPEEKEMSDWLLENKIFSKIFVVSKGEKRGTFVYEEKQLSNIYK